MGASEHPESRRIAQWLLPYAFEWSGLDVDPVEAELFDEVFQDVLGRAEGLSDFDVVLALSVIEHSRFCGDTEVAALRAIRNALHADGVGIVSVPVGVSMEYPDFVQYRPEDFMVMIAGAGLQVLDKRYWYWDGEQFVNAEMQDVTGCLYRDRGAGGASGVGLWVVCHGN